MIKPILPILREFALHTGNATPWQTHPQRSARTLFAELELRLAPYKIENDKQK